MTQPTNCFDPPRHPKAAIRDYFDHAAGGYLQAYAAGAQTTRSQIFLERRRLVLDCLQEPLGRALDIGSGPGAFAQALLDRGCEVWMVDLSVEMVRVGRDQLRGAPLATQLHCQVADIETLPFGDGVFETVLCIGVLQYLVRLDAALREMSRVTRPGGQVIISFPNGASPLNKLHQAAVRSLRKSREVLGYLGITVRPNASRLTFRDDIPNRSFRRHDVQAMAKQAGLMVQWGVNVGVHFPFAVPGLHGPIRMWDRLANRAFQRGWLKSWGRETIVRFRRCT